MSTSRLLRSRLGRVMVAFVVFPMFFFSRAIAQHIPAAVTSPPPGSDRVGPEVTFTWTGANGATWYDLWLSSTPEGIDDPQLTVAPYNESWYTFAQGIAIDAADNTYLSTDGQIAMYDRAGTQRWTTGECPGAACVWNLLPGGVDHVGDVDYYRGILYAPVEEVGSCGYDTHQTLALFSASTGALSSAAEGVGWFDISRSGIGEAGTVTVVPSADGGNGVLVVGDYCDPTELWAFSLSAPGTLLGTIPLSAQIPEIQGVSWNAAKQQFAITSDEPNPGQLATAGYVWLADWDGRVRDPATVVGGNYIYRTTQPAELEGVDYSQGYIAYLIGRVGVFYLTTGDSTFEPSLQGGSSNLYASGPVTSHSVTVPLPPDGETIYARLFTYFNGTVGYSDATFTSVAQAVLTSPRPYAILPGPGQTFTWSFGSGATAYDVWIGSTGNGSHNLYVSGPIVATSVTRTDLPINGEMLYLRLFSDFSGTWKSVDYTFTAASQPARPAHGTRAQHPGANGLTQ